MKRYILLTFSIFLFSFPTMAQDSDVFMECHYAEKYRDNLQNRETVRQDEMVLRIGRHTSEFFSLWQKAHKELKDSILKKGGTVQDILAAREHCDYPVSTQRYVIYKGIPEKGVLTFTDRILKNRYRYLEKMEVPAWRILKDEKEVAGYKCQKAEADFLGRKWIAWFAPDIPVQEGPWKLWGLPGLILEAEDADQDYSFTCMELKNVSQGKGIAIPNGHYIRCEKHEHIKDLTEWEEDPNQAMKKQGEAGIFRVGNDGKSIPVKINKKYNYIER